MVQFYSSFYNGAKYRVKSRFVVHEQIESLSVIVMDPCTYMYSVFSIQYYWATPSSSDWTLVVIELTPFNYMKQYVACMQSQMLNNKFLYCFELMLMNFYRYFASICRMSVLVLYLRYNFSHFAKSHIWKNSTLLQKEN